jgi:two-component system, OmpR family, phosphate regulon response regulator OmpR
MIHYAQLAVVSTFIETRLRGASMSSAYRFGHFTLDLAAHSLFSDDKPLSLTPNEFALLVIFTQHPMQPLSRARIIELLYGHEAPVTERGIDVPVWRLRRLLEDNPAIPRRILTLRRVGYVFVPDGEYEYR